MFKNRIYGRYDVGMSSISLNYLEKLTVVFITKNRQRYLKNNLIRYKSSGASVIVLDGSERAFSDSVLCDPELKLVYIHSKSSLEERLSLAKKYIETDYIVLSGDDDFQVLSSLERSVQFLIENTEYLSCFGGMIHYGKRNSGIYFRNSHEEIDRFRNLKFSNNKYVRSYQYLNHYDSRYVYSVTRSEVWKKVFCNGLGQQELSRNYQELIIEFSLCLQGPSKVLPQVSVVRNSDEPAHRNLGTSKYRIFPSFQESQRICSAIFQKIDSREFGPQVKWFDRLFLISMLIAHDCQLFSNHILGMIAALSRKIRKKQTFSSVLGDDETLKLSEILEIKKVYDSCEEISSSALVMISGE